MTQARLISTCHVTTGYDTIRITAHGGTQSATLSAGDYYFEDDGSADDFCKALQDAIVAVFPANPNWVVYILGCDVRGIGAVTPTGAPGRIMIEHDATFTLERLGDAAWTLPHRVIGHVSTSDYVAIQDGATYYALSNYVHRYGWYPQDVAMSDLTRRVVDVSASFSSDRRRDTVCWSTEDGHLTISLEFDSIHRSLVRIDGCTAAAAAEMNLSTGDVNCGFERFALDCSTSLDCDRQWYYYPDTEVTTGVSGPYVWPPESTLWTDPLSLSHVRDPAGERWAVSLAGTAAIT